MYSALRKLVDALQARGNHPSLCSSAAEMFDDLSKLCVMNSFREIPVVVKFWPVSHEVRLGRSNLYFIDLRPL